MYRHKVWVRLDFRSSDLLEDARHFTSISMPRPEDLPEASWPKDFPLETQHANNLKISRYRDNKYLV